MLLLLHCRLLLLVLQRLGLLFRRRQALKGSDHLRFLRLEKLHLLLQLLKVHTKGRI